MSGGPNAESVDGYGHYNGVFVRIEKPTMLRLIQEHPAFSDLFMAHILKHTIRVGAKLIDLMVNSVDRRLARLLLQLANYDNEGSNWNLSLSGFLRKPLPR